MDAGKRREDFRPAPWPEDFPQRLERLTQLAGLSWEEFAERLGVEDDRVTEWRNGHHSDGWRSVAYHAVGVVGPRRVQGDGAGGRRAQPGRGVAT